MWGMRGCGDVVGGDSEGGCWGVEYDGDDGWSVVVVLVLLLLLWLVAV